jgi:hypothetical protein
MMKRLDKLRLLANRKGIEAAIEDNGLDDLVKSLKGVDGANGKDGKPGRDGKPGQKGLDGRDGMDGQPGKAGPPGLPGKQGDPGIPGLVWRGDWSSGKQYKKNDGVYHLGSSFICLIDHKASSDTEPLEGVYYKNHWSPLALKGEQGERGPAGGAGTSVSAGVQSVVAGTNVTVDNTDPHNPVVSSTGGGGSGTGTVDSVVAGNNIDVDATDPANPIVAVEALTAADITDVTASATELNYTDGVTSAIQTQIDTKAPKASPTFTGTVTLPTGLTGVVRADSGVVSTDSDVTDLVTAASDTAAGKVELATTAETTTGTDAARAVTPDGLHDMTSLSGAAWFLDEDDMASDSATKVPSQQSVKAYVDAVAQGLDIKASVRAATGSGNVTISSAPSTIDSVALTSGDRVLLKNQSTGSQNGIYVFNGTGSALTRATDADTSAKVTTGMFVFVSEGTVNADSGWVLTTNDAITLGTTSLTFTQFTGAGQISAGAGLTKTANTLDVGAGTGITVAADSVAVDFSAVQPLDSDLTTIASLTPTTDNFMVATASAWASRTPAQARTQLGVAIGTDVMAFAANNATSSSTNTFTNKTIDANGTGNSITNLEVADLAAGVLDTDLSSVSASDDTVPSAKATKAALDGKQALDSDLTTIAGLTATTDNFLQSKSSAWASRTPTQVTADLIAMVGDSGSGGTKGLVPAPATGDATKYLKGDGTWGAIAGGGDALKADPLSQFAATTSLQLKNTISDETGSGALVFATSPALVTPDLGTPSAATLTNATGLPIAGLATSTTSPIGVGSIELGHASDTTITRTGAGAIAVEGAGVLLSGGALGTPSSATLTNATGLPVSGITASTVTALGVGSLELGHASDTTLSRSTAGTLAVEGVDVVTTSATQTLTNKRRTARTGTTASSATPTINTDNVDYYSITALSAAITSFTTNLSGTPNDRDVLHISILDNGTARAITWGASFESSTVLLPTTTVVSTRLDVIFIWHADGVNKWRCAAVF